MARQATTLLLAAALWATGCATTQDEEYVRSSQSAQWNASLEEHKDPSGVDGEEVAKTAGKVAAAVGTATLMTAACVVFAPLCCCCR
ncbi:MAG: hypothetical protein ACYTGZ_03545 [Planctomycetota bacterium]|jgi:LPS sulfotransferase NodH